MESRSKYRIQPTEFEHAAVRTALQQQGLNWVLERGQPLISRTLLFIHRPERNSKVQLTRASLVSRNCI